MLITPELEIKQEVYTHPTVLNAIYKVLKLHLLLVTKPIINIKCPNNGTALWTLRKL